MSEETMSVKLVPTGAIREYDVLVDGGKVGTTRYTETRYNLRRVYVTRSWLAYDAAGRKIDKFPLRRDAVAAILQKVQA